MKPIKAASVEFNRAPGDKAKNLATIPAFTATAGARKVDRLVFPEMCITGYWHVRKLSRPELAALAGSTGREEDTRKVRSSFGDGEK